MILQDELSGERLAQEVGALVDSPETISEMEAAARKLARKDAAAAAVDLIERVSAARP
jgi:UDP-N-acetylglucosamine:LPS N-acetylglucosamine transferase